MTNLVLTWNFIRNVGARILYDSSGNIKSEQTKKEIRFCVGRVHAPSHGLLLLFLLLLLRRGVWYFTGSIMLYNIAIYLRVSPGSKNTAMASTDTGGCCYGVWQFGRDNPPTNLPSTSAKTFIIYYHHTGRVITYLL